MVDKLHDGGHSGARGANLLGRPLECIVVTPEATVLESTAEFVALPLYDGEIGIAPGHSPLIGRLGYGEMRITSGNQTKHFFVDGGFVQVAANVVSVLTSRAIPTAEIDARAAAESLAAARCRPANSDKLLAERERARIPSPRPIARRAQEISCPSPRLFLPFSKLVGASDAPRQHGGHVNLSPNTVELRRGTTIDDAVQSNAGRRARQVPDLWPRCAD